MILETSNVLTQLKRNIVDSCNKTKTILEIKYPLDVIQSYSSGLEPTNTYLSVDILSLEKIGIVDNSTSLFDYKGRRVLGLTTHYRVLVQLTFLGDKSGDISFDFINNIRSNHLVREEFLKNCIAPTTMSSLRSNFQKRDTEFIESYNFDIAFNFSATVYQDTDYVEFVKIINKTNF